MLQKACPVYVAYQYDYSLCTKGVGGLAQRYVVLVLNESLPDDAPTLRFDYRLCSAEMLIPRSNFCISRIVNV